MIIEITSPKLMDQDQTEDSKVVMISKEVDLEGATKTLTIRGALSREKKEESHLKAV